ncbi:MAG: hypothetical protein WCL39_09675 [Armatimonadota bacterium]
MKYYIESTTPEKLTFTLGIHVIAAVAAYHIYERTITLMLAHHA